MDYQEYKDLYVERTGGRIKLPLIKRVAYDSSGRPEYIGLAIRGTLDSQWGWYIEKLTYDTGTGVYDNSGFSEPLQVWDNRATTTVYS